MDEKRSARKKAREEKKMAKRVAESVSGVYFGKNRFLRVVDQPNGRPEFVSTISNTATNFQLASRYGNIGLIAHNFLGGRLFTDLHLGDEIFLMDGFGRKKSYLVTELLTYQAISPRSTRSNFIDLNTQQVSTASDVFRRVYTGKHRLVLQTCIKKGTNSEWGRMFVIAQPVNSR